jgi:hypothetical protein
MTKDIAQLLKSRSRASKELLASTPRLKDDLILSLLGSNESLMSFFEKSSFLLFG